MAQRIKTVQESDLRMLGDLARSIQRVLPVTQADIDAAAALGKGWVVTRVFEVSDPLDNLRGGTQLVIRQNSIQPGQSVQRVLIVSGPGGQTVVIRGTDYIVLPDAIANSLQYVKAFGGTEQRNLPLGYTQFGRIHFDGNCYFDTGIVINSLAATVKLIAALDSQTSSSPCLMWGYMGSNSSLPRWGVGLYQDKWLVSANATSTFDTADTDKHIFITELYDNNGIPRWRGYLDGVASGNGSIASSETITGNTLSTYIGARNNNGTAGNYVKGNFTYLEITQDGVCLAKIYPCKRDSDNVLGLYNTVTDEFLPNLGTGTLTADIFASPTPDAPMDIVSNNGVLKYGQYGKNLFDLNTMDTGHGWWVNGGVVNDTPSANRTVVIDCKPNTVYSFWHTEGAGGCRAFALNKDTIAFGDTASWLTDSSPTYRAKDVVIKITTPADAKKLYILAGRVDAAITRPFEDQLADFMVVEGEVETALPYEPYHYGLHTDGTVETIGIKDSNNLLPVDAQPDVLYPVNAIPGQSYVASAKINNGEQLVAVEARYYNQNKEMIDYWTLRNFSDGRMYVRFAINSAAKYVSITRKTGYLSATITDLKFEQGTEMTPYYDGGTATTEMLLKVGDYQDVQSILDGVVTRNVGVKVLDGTESFSSGQASGIQCISIPKTAWGISSDTLPENSLDVICTHYKAVNGSDWAQSKPNTIKVGSGYLFFNTQYVQDSTSFKAYLADQYAAGTPVIVIYPLATPTTESVAGQTLQVTAGDNVLEITQASLDGLELEVEYQAAVSLTIQEVQDANLDNNVEVTIS